VSHAAGAAPEAAPAEDLQYRNRVLRQQLDLASGEAFYLVLDATDGSLALMLRGVVLCEYPVSAITIGSRRITFVSRPDESDWPTRVWEGGRLEPPRERERVEIQVNPTAPSPAEVPIPPAPTEEKTPAHYFVRYSGGLALEVVTAEQTDGSLLSRVYGGLAGRLGEAIQALRAEDRSRLRVVLGSEDAAMLYRSLPPETKLLILPRSIARSS
jgi:hypothetical protein